MYVCRSEAQLHTFLTYTVDGDEWSSSRHDRFIAEKKKAPVSTELASEPVCVQ
jgi:hypothetical protein